MHNSVARLTLRHLWSDSAKPLLFTYNAVHGDAHKYFSNLVCAYKPTEALLSANNNLLTVVQTHVKDGDNLWNTLPHDICLFSNFQCMPKD